MAYIDNSGLLRGKCGNKIYFVRNKQQVVRSLPTKRQTPPSPAQLLHQEKFAIASKLITVFKPLFDSFQSKYTKKTINKFTSYVLKEITVLRGKKIAIQYNRLVLLYGYLPFYPIISFQSNFKGVITLEWDNTKYDYLPPVSVALIVYCPKLKKYKNYMFAERKGKNFAVFAIDKEFGGQKVHCWTYSYLSDKIVALPLNEQHFSCTTYLGSIVVTT